MIIYEMLPLNEWNSLKPLYEELFPNVSFPGPEVSSAVVAKEDGKIVAFWFLQMCAHAEPVGISPEYADKVSLHQLQQTLFDGFKHVSGMEYYITSTDPKLGDILEANGFKQIGILYSNKIP